MAGMKHIILGLWSMALFLGMHPAMAQQTPAQVHASARLKAALELYEQEQYAAAQEALRALQPLFGPQTETGATLAFYQARCAFELFNDDAEWRLSRFVNDYPEHAFRDEALFALGNLYYRNREFKEALVRYNRVEARRLSKDQQQEFAFKKGYAHFVREQYAAAKPLLAEVKDVDNRYAAPATYYYSHIAYLEKKYDAALQGFRKFKGKSPFAPVVPYYIAQILYFQKQYDALIEYAKPILDSATAKRGPEIARLIGDAYYQTGRYKESLPYLKTYAKGGNRLGREDHYQLGYAFYKAGQYESARDAFQKVVVQPDDSLNQLAYYTLGDCHLKLGQKTQARNSFAAAAKLKYNPSINEDALYNFARLSYELDPNPYYDAIAALQQFMQVYPGSVHYEETFGYLVNAFLSSRNYQEALEALEKMDKKSLSLQRAYQKIAYMRGIELFNNGNYTSAIDHLNRSLKYNLQRQTTAQARYWKAEAFYRLNLMDSAILSYRKFLFEPGADRLDEYPEANYGMGYAYFNLADYDQSARAFRKFVGLTGDEHRRKKNDALIRLGDGYFMLRDFSNAIDYYDQALQLAVFNNDYSIFQKAMCMGLLDRLDDKITSLQYLLASYPTSSYRDDAQYELANTYLLKNDEGKAMEAFKVLMTDYPNSSFVRRAQMKLALIYGNTDQNELALTTYQDIIKRFPNSTEAQQALRAMKEIYVELGQVDRYEYFLTTQPNLSIRDGELDSASYEAAELKYMKGDYAGARKDFATYLSKFPLAAFTTQANFYKADCDLRAGDEAGAIAAYLVVCAQPQNIFTEKALLKSAELLWKAKRTEEATASYARLEQLAETPGVLLEARYGQMRGNFIQKAYEPCIEQGNKLLLMEKASAEVLTDVHLLKGKSYLALGRDTLGLQELNTTISTTQSAKAAEALFAIAEYKLSKGMDAESEACINRLIEEYQNYDYWVTRSFLLYAEVFLQRKDRFNAKETLQSVIDHSENTELVAQAKERLNALIAEEKAEEEKFKQDSLEIRFDTNSINDNDIYETKP